MPEVCDACGSVREFVVYLNGSKECLECYDARFADLRPPRERYEKPIRFAGIGAGMDERGGRDSRTRRPSACGRGAEGISAPRAKQTETEIPCGSGCRCAKPPDPPDDLYSDLVCAALDTAELVAEKNAAYGDSFAKSGEVLRILYPDGIRPDQYDDMLALVRDLDKSFRIAARKDAFGENPWRDKLGYALLSVVRDERAASTPRATNEA